MNMNPIRLVLMILAVVCFAIAAMGIPPTNPRTANVIAAGLAFWAVAVLLT